MNKINHLAMFIAFFTTFSTSVSYAAEQSLTFAKAIQIAQKNDPWLDGSRHKQQSLASLSHVANTQPDPKVSFAFANLPTDSFDFSQESMTQFKIGVSQMFARGNSLAIKNQQLKLQSQQHPLQRQDREQKVAVIVGSLWLDLYRVQQSIILIEQNRNLFEQLTQLAEVSYGSGLGKTRQHDIVSAQLELTRLEDKLNQLRQEQSRYQGMLGQWLVDYNFIFKRVSKDLPELMLNQPFFIDDNRQLATEKLVIMLSAHPAIKAIDKKISATRIEIDLAEQKYKPQWGINASYGYRGDDQMNNSRADFFSLGVVLDVPLFTANRQDNEVKSAISKTEVIKTEKTILIRQFISAFSSAKGRFLRLNERESLYKTRLLPQSHDQAQVLLTAYTNDDGDFAEVVRARIVELNAQIDFLAIKVQQKKIILEINYLFSGTTAQINIESES